jgi:hypothetical protein
MAENLDFGTNSNQFTNTYLEKTEMVKEKIDAALTWLSLKFGEICGWFGLVLIHASTLPITYAAFKGEPVILPPLSMVLLVWSGLLLFFIRSFLMKDKIYMVSNGVGFFLQTVMLSLLVFK